MNSPFFAISGIRAAYRREIGREERGANNRDGVNVEGVRTHPHYANRTLRVITFDRAHSRKINNKKLKDNKKIYSLHSHFVPVIHLVYLKENKKNEESKWK